MRSVQFLSNCPGALVQATRAKTAKRKNAFPEWILCSLMAVKNFRFKKLPDYAGYSRVTMNGLLQKMYIPVSRGSSVRTVNVAGLLL